jgi:hypothetical protein
MLSSTLFLRKLGTFTSVARKGGGENFAGAGGGTAAAVVAVSETWEEELSFAIRLLLFTTEMPSHFPH